MAAPTWNPGQILAAADVNSWFVPIAAIKPSDQSVTSSTTLVNDNALVVSFAANCSYEFRCFLYYEGGTTGSSDLKVTWNLPFGTATFRYSTAIFGSSGNSSCGNLATGASVIVLGTNGAGNPKAAIFLGSLLAGTASGTLQLQWAQNTSNATSTTIHAQSSMALARVA